jgi:hypothetical protein
MPGLEHGIASWEFLYCIYNEIQAMNLDDEINSLGSSTVQIGNWRKEAGECWGTWCSTIPYYYLSIY